jgi:hypothetical protein
MQPATVADTCAFRTNIEKTHRLLVSRLLDSDLHLPVGCAQKLRHSGPDREKLAILPYRRRLVNPRPGQC